MILTVLAFAAAVADRRPDNALVAELERCLAVADDGARLACHDAAARRLVDAARTRDLVVVDREQVKRTRRSLFGLNLGDADPITGKPEAEAERIETLDTVVRGFAPQPGGRWLLTLAEGGRWQTTEQWSGGSEPERDAKVTVRRGALGSYLLKMDGARAVRVRRVN